ncbi:glycerophosphodiester phosphodiesterase family protein [Corynebacterium jeikeium]|uniref:glycerophosphodiester phosphodiesterase family protein n=1 Tax=Corynebacterium jeikeium TaxID=38289 RepID=UPI00087E0A19|nr:glycerophosphodiester phosphodiesterase family protein [Corynebacterium jeikeium]SCX13258.1 cytoplasmic glycerophosphodiester phosphodiesterase [Corynebacterium jeikeium]
MKTPLTWRKTAAAAVAAIVSLGSAGTAVAATNSSVGSSIAGSSFNLTIGSSTTPQPEEEQGFDLQSHRGGRGEYTEESRKAFEESVKMGVSTLELDIVLAEDGTPVVWHDPEIQADKCTDTKPATENDPEFPYVGKLIHELNWKQLQTLNCNKVLKDFPDAKAEEENKLLQLQDVFDIAAADPQMRFNIETKIEAEDREKSAEPKEFVDAILPVVRANKATSRTTIQSFDWRSLPLVRKAQPDISLALLYSAKTWASGSKWIGDVDYDKVGGDVNKAAKQLGAEILSPHYKLVTPENVASAHEADLQVLPWTVNEKPDMQAMIDAKVDGLITDYPTRGMEVLKENKRQVL